MHFYANVDVNLVGFKMYRWWWFLLSQRWLKRLQEHCRQIVARCLCMHARLRRYQQFDLYIEERSLGRLIGSFNWTFAMVSSFHFPLTDSLGTPIWLSPLIIQLTYTHYRPPSRYTAASVSFPSFCMMVSSSTSPATRFLHSCINPQDPGHTTSCTCT